MKAKAVAFARSPHALASALVVASLLVASRPANADAARRPAKHTAFGELLGAGLGFMANYDYRFRSWLSVRGGLGYSFSTGVGEGEYGNVVVSVHALYGLSGAHHLEASPGFGALTEIGGDRSATIVSLLGGYRYQRPDGGLFARVQLGLGVFDRSDKDTKTIPVVGVAAGWTL